MVYSASAIMAADRFHDPLHFLKRQGLWVLLGMGALWAGMRFDYRRLERLVVPLMAASFVLLVLVLVPPFGQEINGTRRWLRLALCRSSPWSSPSSRSSSTSPHSSLAARRPWRASAGDCSPSSSWRAAWRG